jgi:hypothetical protein
MRFRHAAMRRLVDCRPLRRFGRNFRPGAAGMTAVMTGNRRDAGKTLEISIGGEAAEKISLGWP